MNTVYIVFLALAISHLALLGCHFLLHHRQELIGRLMALFTFSVISYLIICAPEGIFHLNPFLDVLLRRYGNFCTLLLWVISYYLFVDTHEIKPIVWILAAYFLIFRAIGSILGNMGFPNNSLIFTFTYILPEIVKIGFIAHAFYLVIKGYKLDLLLERRKERVAVVAGMGILLLMIVVNTAYLIFTPYLKSILFLGSSPVVFSTYSHSPIPTILYSIYIYFYCAGFMLWKFTISDSSSLAFLHLPPKNKDQLSNAIKSKEAQLIKKIKHAMEIDKLYRQHKLTVQDLANCVSSQEYKVRIAINNHMQFRNFSDFLNHYRILESAKRLVETQEGISNIGLDVGYISLSSFHKAFKGKYNVTPKEFRVRGSQANR